MLSTLEITSDDKSSRPSVLREGQTNYKEWERFINNTLLIKDLSNIVDGSYPAPAAAQALELRTWKKADRKAFGYINQSLDKIVFRSLPNELSVSSPKLDASQSKLLMEHLASTYSVGSAARKAELLQVIFRTELMEGEDPNPHCARIRGAFGDFVGTGETLSDSILAYAILMSLPKLYTTLVQTYYLANTSSSADVLSAVRTEWHRRTGEVNKAAALAAKVRISTPTLTPGEPMVFKQCSLHGECAHTTKECNVLKARAKAANCEARIAASSLEPPEPASATAALASVSLSSANAFLATSSLDPSSSS
jgi:hypothetical protein